MESSGIVFKVDATDGANQRLDVVIEASGPFTSPSLKLISKVGSRFVFSSRTDTTRVTFESSR